jgi:hypothetical protein
MDLMTFILVCIGGGLFLSIMVILLGARDKRAAQKAVFILNETEALGGYVFTDRLPDFGGRISIKDLTDEEFFNRVTVVGVVVYANNEKSVFDRADIDLDVARKRGELEKILFAEELAVGDMIQVIIT